MSGFCSPRSVRAGLTLGLAPAGRVGCNLPLAFPPKFVNETLDYEVDFTLEAGEAAPAGTVLNGFIVTSLPVGSAALNVSQMNVNGLAAQFYLGGGVAGMQYMVTVTATLPSGAVMQAVIALRVIANPAPNNQPCAPAPAADIDAANGDVITDTFGNPITSA